ncbi:LLM class flavin-dependent oxidoreductase [Nakamurella leprariae]|uniref:LLM class flavin-dependent oxidoreductase n=1 Tax=Nakamurella leprariae TaxID=2803911 RepID=A0A938YF12_9ACTN|nr:LLM class flavin-dependent oxidoreductase [Nakamurella leprariae]MBM9469502.1 LLM class flavin-dependent oxidoreductase [Nakamurella leprariae]
MRREVWLHGFPVPGRVVPLARRAEASGYTGLLLADSEILVGDPYVELALAAAATSRLRLGPGVTNPITRHPAVTASALASLHGESGGRAVAILGRGDSAVRQLGLAPASTPELERAVREVRGFLSGRPVQLEAAGVVAEGNDGPTATMRWFTGDALLPVPVSVAATGPATIAAGVRAASRVDLTVGADPARIAWAVDVARRAAGPDQTVSLGAFVNVAVHPDVTVARQLVRGSAAIFAHFVSEGPLRSLSDGDRAVISRFGRAYQEAQHGLSTADHVALLPDEFLDRFAVLGSAEQCLDRLHRLFDLGLDRIIVVPGSRDADPALLAEADERFADQVLPRLIG